MLYVTSFLLLKEQGQEFVLCPRQDNKINKNKERSLNYNEFSPYMELNL